VRSTLLPSGNTYDSFTSSLASGNSLKILTASSLFPIAIDRNVGILVIVLINGRYYKKKLFFITTDIK
jgi:hypothetical protein